LPAFAAAGAVVLATGFALSRKAHAAQGIRQASELGDSLSAVASIAQDRTLDQVDLRHLEALEKDLQARMADAREPSLVQAELMQSAGKAGLVLRETRPLPEVNRPGGKESSAGYLRYRVSVTGTYRQIAEYMQLCSRQRLPVRAVEFQVRPVEPGEWTEDVALIADITVEAFRPPDSTAKEDRN
jgi:Tfp pilus assembly protein PilO